MIVILIMAAVLHSRAIGIPISATVWDNLTSNPAQAGLSSFFSNFMSLKGLLQRPLSVFSFAATFEFFKEPTVAHRFINFLFHLASGLLIYILARTYQLKWPWLAALLFLVHPLSTAVTSQLLGRSYAMATFFFISALILLERSRSQKIKEPLASLFIFLLIACAVFSKQTFVIIPLIFLWRRFSLFSPKGSALFIESKALLAALVVIGLIFIWLYALPLSATAGANRNTTITSLEYFISQLGNWHNILGLYLAPYRLAFNNPYPFFKSLWNPHVLTGAIFLGAFIVWVVKKRNTLLGFFGGGFLLMLLPTNSFLPKNEVLIPWRLYPAIVFVSLAIAYLAEKHLKHRHLLPVFATTAALFFSFIVIRQNEIYRDELKTYRQVVDFFPESRSGPNQVANFFVREGRFQEAVETVFDYGKRNPDTPLPVMPLRSIYQLSEGRDVEYLNSHLFSKPEATTTTYFGQAQSFLEAYRGSPLISANWSGRFRPYSFQFGEFKPLFSDAVVAGYEDFDFYSPTPFSKAGIILAGQEAGRRNFKLFYYNLHTLIPLIPESEEDQGDLCVSPKGEWLAFRHGDQQRILNYRNGIWLAGSETLPGFNRCLWLDERRFLGMRGRRAPYEIYVCGSKDSYCTSITANSEIQEFLDFYRTSENEIGFLGLTKDEKGFRRAYAFNDDFSQINHSKRNPDMLKNPGDLLQIEGPLNRVGLLSRYFIQPRASTDEEEIVSRIKRIGNKTFGIVSSPENSRTLAELRLGRWKIFRHPSFKMPKEFSKPKEIWIQGHKGSLFQNFYFGPETVPEKIVLWWHGGPRENVSPRFNPYFHHLNRLGFGVLALNYPGSTGRGAGYEAIRLPSGEMKEFFQAVFQFLRENGVKTVASWSVSAGVQMQKQLLREGYRVSGIIDQVGGLSTSLKQYCIRQRIPFFSIRGIHDLDHAEDSVNFLYRGGHDISTPEDFDALFKKVAPFLTKKMKTWGTPESRPLKDIDFILDAGHTGSSLDANAFRNIKESDLTFELASLVNKECLSKKKILLTRSGQPSWEDPLETLKRRQAILTKADRVRALSLHFNASPRIERSKNLSSAFVPWEANSQDIDFARKLIRELTAINLPGKESYPEFTEQIINKLEPGIFSRKLALLKKRSAATVLLESAYYDDEQEYSRLSNRQWMVEEGLWQRPRLKQIATAICSALKN